MSTPEQPATPALTRKQLREIRNTGATPIVTADAAAADASAAPTPPVTSAPIARPDQSAPARSVPTAASSGSPVASTPVVPLARPADPPVLPPPPVADSAVELGVAPLTRRQARQQERIRTASVPVITPEVAAGYTSAATDAPAAAKPDAAPPVAASQAPVAEPPARVWPVRTTETSAPKPPTFGSSATPKSPLFGAPARAPQTPAPEAPAPQTPAPQAEPTSETGESGVPSWLLSAAGATEERSAEEAAPAAPSAAASAPSAPAPTFEPAPERPEDRSDTSSPTTERGVNSQLGAGLLAEGAPNVVLPPSFDELITSASTSGSSGTPNALIVPQPDHSGIVAPVAATGEVLVTGTFNLPEGLGSTGAIPGTADGKEVDAVLVDGELPAHSSPTPIAASAAISTVKTPGEIIKPPTPEKGSRLMISLAITAGALALALVGVLILAFVTGVL